MITKFYTFTAKFMKEPGTADGYTVIVPALKGCVTYGDSKREAEFMAQDAIKLYLESLIEDNETIPTNIRPTQPKKGFTKDVVVGLNQEVTIGFPAYETPRFTSA